MKILNSELLKLNGNIKGREHMVEILENGLMAADPYYNTFKLFTVEDNKLYVGYSDFIPKGSPRLGTDIYNLKKDIDRIFVIGAGKGIQRIALAIEEILKDNLSGGYIILKHGDESDLKKIDVAYAGHPIPDKCSVNASIGLVKAIKDMRLTERDLVITIFGNGASALMTLPQAGLDLEDIKETTRILQIEKGLPTIKVNYIRTQLDQLKGGRVTRLLFPSRMVHIVPIDLNEPNSFGVSGYKGCTQSNIWIHSLPDMSTMEEAVSILRENDAWEIIPTSIRNYMLKNNPEQEVLKVNEFEKMDCRIFGIMPTEHSFIPAAMKKARQLGYETHFLMRKTQAEASAMGVFISQIARNVADINMPFKAPCALFLTGELIVKVGKEKGIGGRNQEFVLSAASVIKGYDQIVIGAVDTDGTDGPGGYFNDEASALGCYNLSGGIVDGYTVNQAEVLGIDIANALKTHNTSDTLWRLGSGVWATQNISVQDLIVVLIMEKDGLPINKNFD